jgi:hypothetical protein
LKYIFQTPTLPIIASIDPTYVYINITHTHIYRLLILTNTHG